MKCKINVTEKPQFSSNFASEFIANLDNALTLWKIHDQNIYPLLQNKPRAYQFTGYKLSFLRAAKHSSFLKAIYFSRAFSLFFQQYQLSFTSGNNLVHRCSCLNCVEIRSIICAGFNWTKQTT